MIPASGLMFPTAGLWGQARWDCWEHQLEPLNNNKDFLLALTQLDRREQVFDGLCQTDVYGQQMNWTYQSWSLLDYQLLYQVQFLLLFYSDKTISIVFFVFYLFIYFYLLFFWQWSLNPATCPLHTLYPARLISVTSNLVLHCRYSMITLLVWEETINLNRKIKRFLKGEG